MLKLANLPACISNPDVLLNNEAPNISFQDKIVELAKA